MDSIQSTFQNFIANVFPSQAKAVTNDPILLLAKYLDLPITFYRVEPAPWLNFLIYGPFHLSVLTVLGLVLFQASRLGAGSYLRALAAVLGAVFFTTWPLFIRSGLDFLDFGIPAFAFLGSLHIVDIFFVRDPKEVESWTLRRFLAQFLAFPDEASQHEHPFSHNLAKFPGIIYKALAFNFILYFVPPKDLYEEIKSPLAIMGYNSAAGLCVLFFLGTAVSAIIIVFGLIFQMDMQDMFQNPLLSTNPREFWAKWNLAVKNSLQSVVFLLVQGKKPPPVVQRLKKDTNAAKKKFNDQLSETEVSASDDDAPAVLRARASSSGIQERQGPYGDLKKRNGGPAANGRQAPGEKVEKREKPRKKGSSFLFKAAAALATFAVSGAFHEYMIYVCFGRATGENMAFFMVHGVAVCASVWATRKLPNLTGSNWFFNFVLLQIFVIATTPLFCNPFLKYGFFEHVKNASIFNRGKPIEGFIWIFGK